MDYFATRDPHDEGYLDAGGGHKVFWTASGNPDGVPALILHGGPGTGSIPGQRGMWNPDRYLIVQMDQRNCGKSTPSAADPATRLTDNTTQHLIDDIERLRERLGVDRWVLWGGSWGSTLALVYAQQHPGRVRAMVLVFMMLARRGDLRWLYQEMGRYFPEEWDRFVAGAGDCDPDDLLAAYNQLLNETADEQVQRAAALEWCAWEAIISSLDPGWKSVPLYEDPDFILQFSRITTHYFSNDAFLDADQVLRDAHKLADIPAVIIHGRDDRANPYDMAWRLAKAYPTAEFRSLPGVGHTPASPSARDAILEATTKFADLP